jgi:hypothetical protein
LRHSLGKKEEPKESTEEAATVIPSFDHLKMIQRMRICAPFIRKSIEPPCRFSKRGTFRREGSRLKPFVLLIQILTNVNGFHESGAS